MVMERMPEGPPATASVPADPDAARRALRVQMLATEHWSLLATRSLSWNESFSRAGMFLSLLSMSVVALALVAQATAFGDAFAIFALLLLPVVLFVGVATYVRLVEINNEDYVWVLGMNRLRRAYLELEPDLASHFITGTTEDHAGVMLTYGTHAGGSNLGHGLITTPTTIAFVDAMIAAVLASIALVQLSMPMEPVAAVGVVVFLATILVLWVIGYRSSSHALAVRTLQEGRRGVAGAEER
jgi:hypothetical protein